MDERTKDSENPSGYVNYEIHKDCTQTGSVSLEPKLLRLSFLTFFDQLECEMTYTVEKEADIAKFYEAINCKPTDEPAIVKRFLLSRFPQPKAVKDFIDANAMAYKCSSSSRGVGYNPPRLEKQGKKEKDETNLAAETPRKKSNNI